MPERLQRKAASAPRAVLVITGGLRCPGFRPTPPSDYTPLGGVARFVDAHELPCVSSLSEPVCGRAWHSQVAALPADSIGFHRVVVYLRLVDKPALGAP
jgi:hypothetical protein